LFCVLWARISVAPHAAKPCNVEHKVRGARARRGSTGAEIFLDSRWKHGMGRAVMSKMPQITLLKLAASAH